MSRSISVFPKISEELIPTVFNGRYHFSTNRNNVYSDLIMAEASDEKRQVVLFDSENDPWSITDSSLEVCKEIHMKNLSRLFGKEGIACKTATIGVGLRWYSKESRQRGVLEVAEFELNTWEIKKTYSVTFEKSSLRNSLVLETILYIKKSGTPNEDEVFLANKNGAVIGELDYINIRLDGAGSEMQILEEDNEDQNAPLWTVHTGDWVDPSVDAFNDYFEIILNRKNRNFKYIDRNNENYDPYAMIEIVSSALTILVLKLKEEPNDWDAMSSNRNLEEGSISQAVYYFLHTLNMNFDSPLSIHESFRIYYENLEREVQKNTKIKKKGSK